MEVTKLSTSLSSGATAIQLVESNANPSGVALVNANKVHKVNDPMDLVALAQQVQKADDYVLATAGSKLSVIAEQIRFLQSQAKRVLEEAKRDNDLHHAACNLVKKPGQIYYLYRRDSGESYFSLLSPTDWGSGCPYEFLGAYKLQYDMSWTPFEDIQKRDEELAVIDKVLNSQKAILDACSMVDNL